MLEELVRSEVILGQYLKIQKRTIDLSAELPNTWKKMDDVQLLEKHLIEVEHGESGVDCNPCN